MYIKHGTTNLVTYFMSPNQRNDVIIEELNEENKVGIEPKKGKQKLLDEPQHENNNSLLSVGSSSLPFVVNEDASKSLSPKIRRTRN